MNLLSKGISWFNDKRETNLVEPVRIKTLTVEKVVSATIVEPETYINPQGIKVKTNKYVFLITSAQLTGIDLSRGLFIIRGDELYEAVIDKSSLSDYNDPNNSTIAISAQRRPYAPN